MADSSISKFFEKSLKERLDIVADFSGLSQDELKIIKEATGGISYNEAERMIENAIGTFTLPLGIASNAYNYASTYGSISAFRPS